MLFGAGDAMKRDIANMKKQMKKEKEQYGSWEAFVKNNNLNKELCVYVGGGYKMEAIPETVFAMGQAVNIASKNETDFIMRFLQGYYFLEFYKPEDATMFRLQWNPDDWKV